MPNSKGYTLTYDGVASTTIPEFICHQVRRQLVGEARHSVEVVAGLEGGWFFPEMPGMKLIEVDASVMADSYPDDRRSAVKEVAKWLSKSVLCKLIVSDDPSVFNWAALNEAPQVDEWRELGSFTLPFIAHPYTYELTTDTFSDVAGDLTDSFIISVDGDVFTYPVIEVTAGSAMASFEMTMNGRTLTYETGIGAGATVTFNCISRTVTTGASIDTELVGVFDTDDLSMAGVSGLFPYLLPGNNTLQTVSNVSGYTVSVEWRNRYL